MEMILSSNERTTVSDFIKLYAMLPADEQKHLYYLGQGMLLATTYEQTERKCTAN